MNAERHEPHDAFDIALAPRSPENQEHNSPSSSLRPRQIQSPKHSYQRSSGITQSLLSDDEGIPLAPTNEQTFHGIPAKRSLVTWKEALLALFCVAISAFAVSIVALPRLASLFGQTNQLVVLGVAISASGFCSRRSLTYMLLCIETRTGHKETPTTLQNLNAILFSDPLCDHASWWYRPIFVAMLGIPLALGAAYKSFSGGQSGSSNFSEDLHFGMTGPPSTQHIGYGLSLFVNATLPWFSDPGFQRTYGFNTFVMDENTTAMLDGPLPSDVLTIQSGLGSGDSMEITATVNATICALNDTLLYDREWLNGTYYEDISGQGENTVAFEAFVYNSSFQLGIMTPDAETYSTFWMSWWNILENESFGSEVRQYSLRRQPMRAQWTMTANSISLTNASMTEGIEDPAGADEHLVNNWLAIGQLFSSSITEYDYKFRKYGLSRSVNNTKYDTYIKTDATLVASVLWARITALNGPEVSGPSDPGSKGYVSETTLQRTSTTLKRDWRLYVLLSVLPVVTLVAMFIRLVCFRRSPVSQGFGLVSLLAATDPEHLAMLQGAGLSGRLHEKMPMQFRFVALEDNNAKVGISVQLGSEGNNLGLSRQTEYW